MTIAEIMKKMITFSNGNIHDIDHFLHVWSYAKMIGELEQIDPETQFGGGGHHPRYRLPALPPKVWQYQWQASGRRRNPISDRFSFGYRYDERTD